MIVRLVRADDLDALVELAMGADRTMTSMPKSREAMAKRVDKALASAAAERVIDGHEAYLFVLEEDGRLLGVSAIYAQVGLDRPFYSYKVSSISQTSPDLDVRVDTRLMHLVNDFTGHTVLGTLFIDPAGRGGGRGRLLSLTRFMFLATQRDRFPDRVLAEMRGFTDAEGGSDFWDAVGRRFFQLEFTDADIRSTSGVRFISDLFPTYPIYADLLPESAQAVIGKPHPDAAPAASLLREQGLRNHDYVDIFDAGLCLDAFIDDVEIVRTARRVQLASAPASPEIDGPLMLVAEPTMESFAVTATSVELLDADVVALPPTVLQATGWQPGAELVIANARRAQAPLQATSAS